VWGKYPLFIQKFYRGETKANGCGRCLEDEKKFLRMNLYKFIYVFVTSITIPKKVEKNATENTS